MDLILKNRNFRTFVFAQTFRDITLMLFVTSNGWLVLDLTDSTIFVGLAAGCGGLGMLITSLLAGSIVDRVDRKKILALSHFILSITFLVVVLFIWTGSINIWILLLTTFIDGSCTSFRFVCGGTITMDLVGSKDLSRATAINFSCMTITGIFITAIGGNLIDRYGFESTYLLMSICAFISSVILILGLPSISKNITDANRTSIQELRDGISYIKQNKRIRSLLLLGLSSEVFGWAHESMVPVVTKYVLGGGSVELGYILASGQVGALISTLVLSNYRIKKNRTLILYLTYILFGLFLIGFVWSKILLLSMLLYCLVFLAVATYEVVLHSLMQTIVPNVMRGRVVSFQILTWGATGISGFMLGVLAGFTSPPIAITINTSILVLNGTRNIVKKILTNKSILSYWQ
ncbi:MAG: MFS transporter [SAR202 cluster bacterium]|nr:MFS transporter [SAR202 cluster bacterium]